VEIKAAALKIGPTALRFVIGTGERAERMLHLRYPVAVVVGTFHAKLLTGGRAVPSQTKGVLLR
jgi:hypothetical protein